MLLKKYNPLDYKELCSFWSKHNHPEIPATCLPDGIVVKEDDKILCFGFIYLVNNASIAQIAWTTTNPEIGLKKRYKAVNMLFDGSISYIHSLGIKNIMCFSDKPSLVKLLNRRGMRIANDHTLCIESF